MKQIILYLRSFCKEGFNSFYFLSVLLMLGLIIYLNYVHQLYAGIGQYSHSAATLWLLHYLLYLIPFAAAFLLQGVFFCNCTYFRKQWFWIILFVSPAIFAFRIVFNAGDHLLPQSWNGDTKVFGSYCIHLLVRAAVIIISVWIIWLVKDKKNQPFYGIKKTGTLRPYGLMLLCMVPLIVIASTQKDFLQMYPRAKFLLQSSAPQPLYRYIVYEICYGLDFIDIEIFFRGFLILSLLNICGTRSIVPMACFYCCIHLGKPAGEAISSIGGGLVLGIISYYTRSIRGGLFVHLGIAWLMEAGGWLGAFFFH